MVVVKLLQKGAENGFGHPAGSTFAQVSSRCQFLNDKMYCCVITRNGPVRLVLEDGGRRSDQHWRVGLLQGGSLLCLQHAGDRKEPEGLYINTGIIAAME